MPSIGIDWIRTKMPPYRLGQAHRPEEAPKSPMMCLNNKHLDERIAVESFPVVAFQIQKETNSSANKQNSGKMH